MGVGGLEGRVIKKKEGGLEGLRPSIIIIPLSLQGEGDTGSEVVKLKDWLGDQIKTTKEDDQKAHFYYALKTIEQFQTNPDNFVLPVLLPTPPGAPIGN